MPSKYCPKCGRINSSNSIPLYCMWGCGSLEQEPTLPEYENWPQGGYNEMCKIAQQEYENRNRAKIWQQNTEIEFNQMQLTLF